MIRLLHLSDLHFGDNHCFRQTQHDPGTPTLARVITDSLGMLDKRQHLDCVILSGDFFSVKTPEDAELAQDGVRELMMELRVAASSVVCVPGNHDLTWDPQFDRFRFYDSFVKHVGLGLCASPELPQVHEVPNGVGKPLCLLLLDSCQVESQEMAGFGRIGYEQLARGKKKLQERKITSASHTIMAVLHHHLLPISPIEQMVNPLSPRSGPMRTTSLTIDAVEVLQELIALGVTAIAHGHQHRPAVLKYENLLLNTHRAINLLAAGSCGIKPDSGAVYGRQFFVYELEDIALRVRTFTGSKTGAYAFEEMAHAVTIPLVPHDSAVCDAERQVQFNVSKVRESPPQDNSDLYFLLISVVDCPKSREIIRRTLATPETAKKLKKLGALYLEVSGMYDLLGYWDLLVRFRLDQKANATNFVALILDALSREGMYKEGSTYFGSHVVIDVHQEWHAIEEIDLTARQSSASVERYRLRFGDTTAYEKARCQRAFVYVDLPQPKKDAIVHALREAIRLDPESKSVLESVCLGPDELLFDVFMTCAQSSLINKLNRTVERTIGKYKAQKYTHICYGYDETPLSIDFRKPGTGRKPRAATARRSAGGAQMNPSPKPP